MHAAFAEDGTALALHMAECTAAACEYATEDAQSFEVYTATGERLAFAGCPRQHIDAESQRWILAHASFKTFGRTPIELGWCDAHELDPRWYEAVMVVESEAKHLESEAMKSSKPQRPGAK